MKQIILCRFFFTVGLFVLIGCQSAQMTLAQYVEKQAQHSNGKEYSQFRNYAYGDIDGDGKEDAAVVYTLEGIRGGNDWLRFLAVKLSSENGRIIFKQVGDKDIRSVVSIKIANGKIVASTLEYASNDASCCPSISKTATFVIKNGKLFEAGK
jgi:major membrane immunogen (membrane-anchored lipoprotein)